MPGRIVLVTGANRGIGREVVRQLAAGGDTVLLGARDPDKGERAAAELGVDAVHLDVTDVATIDAAAAGVADRHGHLDVLVNNAGIDYDTWEAATASSSTPSAPAGSPPTWAVPAAAPWLTERRR